MNSVRSDTLGKIIDSFIGNFFPYENRDNIVDDIRDILVADKNNFGTITNHMTNILDEETLENEKVLANSLK